MANVLEVGVGIALALLLFLLSLRRPMCLLVCAEGTEEFGFGLLTRTDASTELLATLLHQFLVLCGPQVRCGRRTRFQILEEGRKVRLARRTRLLGFHVHAPHPLSDVELVLRFLEKPAALLQAILEVRLDALMQSVRLFE